MTSSFWTHGEIPAQPNQSDGTPGIAPGLRFYTTVPGVITHIRFLASGTVSGTYTGELWTTTGTDASDAGTGTLQYSEAFSGTPSAGNWNLIELDIPYRPTPFTELLTVDVHNSAGRYVNTNGVFTSAGAASDDGCLVAPQNGTDPLGNGWTIHNGVFAISATDGAYPNLTGTQANYFVDVVFEADPPAEETLEFDAALPKLGADFTAEVTATATVDITLPALASSITATVSATATVDAALPPLAASWSTAGSATAQIAATLPKFSAAWSAQQEVVGTLTATLPALRAGLTGSVEGFVPDSGLVAAYRAMLADLRAAFAAVGSPLRVVDDFSETVGSKDVVIGPPVFQWEGMCSPDEPTGATFDVFLIEDQGDRAVERLLTNLPTLLVAVGDLGAECLITGCIPAAFPSATVDLPSYQISAEITF